MSGQTGWYYTYSYDAASCKSSAAYGATVYATGVCLQQSSNLWTKIDCTDANTCTTTFYTDATCSSKLFDQPAKSGCVEAGDTNSNYYGYVPYTSNIGSVLPPTGYVYAVATFYNGDCSTKPLLAFDGTVVDQCVADTAFSSIYMDYPVETSYNTTTNCQGTFSKKTLPVACTATGKTGTSFTYASSVTVGTTAINSNSNDDDNLSDGEIAGVVIGVILIVGILVGLGYYCFVYRGQKKDALLKNQMTLGSEDQRASASSSSVNLNWK